MERIKVVLNLIEPSCVQFKRTMCLFVLSLKEFVTYLRDKGGQ